MKRAGWHDGANDGLYYNPAVGEVVRYGSDKTWSFEATFGAREIALHGFATPEAAAEAGERAVAVIRAEVERG